MTSNGLDVIMSGDHLRYIWALYCPFMEAWTSYHQIVFEALERSNCVHTVSQWIYHVLE